MDPLLILIGVFAIFIPALILPGPDFVAVVRSSMTRGSAAGLFTACGVTLGLGLYATLSLVGLSAILIEFHWLAWLIRGLGGLFLIYLGVRLILARSDSNSLADDAIERRGNPFLFGFLVTLTNPKAIVLFASVFATAMHEAPPVWLIAVMIALVMTSSLVWYAFVALCMSSGPVMRRFGRLRHWLERAAGVCFVAIGGKLLTDARNPVTP